jgi:hypothetical protein
VKNGVLSVQSPLEPIQTVSAPRMEAQLGSLKGDSKIALLGPTFFGHPAGFQNKDHYESKTSFILTSQAPESRVSLEDGKVRTVEYTCTTLDQRNGKVEVTTTPIRANSRDGTTRADLFTGEVYSKDQIKRTRAYLYLSVPHEVGIDLDRVYLIVVDYTPTDLGVDRYASNEMVQRAIVKTTTQQPWFSLAETDKYSIRCTKSLDETN